MIMFRQNNNDKTPTPIEKAEKTLLIVITLKCFVVAHVVAVIFSYLSRHYCSIFSRNEYRVRIKLYFSKSVLGRLGCYY